VAIGTHARHGLARYAAAYVFVGALLADAPQAERAAFLKLLLAPIRVAWHVAGRGIHHRAQHHLRGVERVHTGR
jgi:hypothetical protein